MRGVLLAFALLTVPIAGCLGPAVTIQEPSLENGTLLTYQIERDGNTTTETFVVVGTSDGGYDLRAWNVTPPGIDSPLLHLGSSLTPRAFNWSGVVSWPLESQGQHEARVGGADATVRHEPVEAFEGPNGTTDGVRLVATADGEQVGEFVVLSDPVVLQYVDLDTPDGTRQTWTLERVDRADPINQPPSWGVGDWWSYNVSTRGHATQSTLVHNAHDETRKGSRVLVLNPTEVSDRVPSFPFLRFRASDLAPQSGYLTGLISSFWKWPLHESQTWSGTTSLGSFRSYQATVDVRDGVGLPDGSLTTAFRVELRPYQQPDADAFATYTYAPRVSHLTSVVVEDPATGERLIDWKLTDWGTGFHGEMEVPRSTGLHDREQTRGPASVDDAFVVPEHTSRVQLRGVAVRKTDADENVTFRLVRPDGSTSLTINETSWRDRLLEMNRAVDAVNGTWHFRAEVPEDVSFFAQITGHWIETNTVDYR